MSRADAASEDAVDAAAMDAMYETDNGETFPAELLKRLLAGDNPIRVYREYRELTGAKLAAAAGISQSYLSQIETGKRDGSLSANRAIAKALGITLVDLYPD